MLTSADRIKYHMRNWSSGRIKLDESKNVQESHSAHTDGPKALYVGVMYIEDVRHHLGND